MAGSATPAQKGSASGSVRVVYAVVASTSGGTERAGPTGCYALHQLSVYRPLLRRLRIAKPFGEGVDENETGYVFGIGARIKPDDQSPARRRAPRRARTALRRDGDLPREPIHRDAEIHLFGRDVGAADRAAPRATLAGGCRLNYDSAPKI